MGYDVHGFAEGRALVLGGVEIPFELGLQGHSDADVLTHAIMDAMLGAAGLGDIGQHFPDTDPAYKGADSLRLLEEVGEKIAEQGLMIENIDATLMAQKPKLAPHVPMMRAALANALLIDESQINIKATTTEGLGFVGRLEGMAAQAICLLATPGDVMQIAGGMGTSGGCGGCSGCGR